MPHRLPHAVFKARHREPAKEHRNREERVQGAREHRHDCLALRPPTETSSRWCSWQVPRAEGGSSTGKFFVKFSALGKWVSLQKSLLNLGCTEKHTYVLYSHLKPHMTALPTTWDPILHRLFTRCHIKWCFSINTRSISPKVRSYSPLLHGAQTRRPAVQWRRKMSFRLFVPRSGTCLNYIRIATWQRESESRPCVLFERWYVPTFPYRWIPNDIPNHHS